MSMRHHELTEFDAACRRSLDDADAWLDRFLDGGGCTTKGCLPGGVGKPAYPPQRTTDSYDDDLVVEQRLGGTTHPDHRQHEMGWRPVTSEWAAPPAGSTSPLKQRQSWNRSSPRRNPASQWPRPLKAPVQAVLRPSAFAM